jgi:hypothetical protein
LTGETKPIYLSAKGRKRSTSGYRAIEEEEELISHGDRMEVTLRAFVIWEFDEGTFQTSGSDCVVLGGQFGRDAEKPLFLPGNEPY